MNGFLTLGVAGAGCAGAVARFVIDGVIRARSGRTFPLGTLAINVSGSLVLGLLTGFVLFHNETTVLATIAGTGFCGGFTTFSTASFETVRLVQARAYRLAVLNGGGTLVLSCAAAAIGLVLTRI
jgi:fluoride exporter